MSDFDPYVPRLTLQWALDAPARRHLSLVGSLVFIDISGFTKMSERLARKGKVGAEEVSGAIDVCFSELLEVSYRLGGSLLKFGGDALLLLFDGVEHPARAARAAWDMRQALRTVGKLETSAGKVNLRMSCGIHSGTL
ncbi:MAG TPA: adenylate/guanylate cyclase domain-containing protein, partial [Actinomycetota bacterium]|nr:adenylate/guanylate cyclase domain-containing protein [Actinomycetota bacterium]